MDLSRCFATIFNPRFANFSGSCSSSRAERATARDGGSRCPGHEGAPHAGESTLARAACFSRCLERHEKSHAGGEVRSGAGGPGWMTVWSRIQAKRRLPHRSGGLLASALLGVEALLHGLRGLKFEHLLRGDLDRLACPGISPFSCPALDDLEAPEAEDRDLLALTGGLGNGLEYPVDEVARMGFGELELFSKGLDEIVLVHHGVSGWIRRHSPGIRSFVNCHRQAHRPLGSIHRPSAARSFSAPAT